ncbi:hypothetical protein BN1723_014987 [Verticillium longisporum]|uniref:Uncharacterized protein n=1 Tax=Verticillium longisporum TaxID=100787 RepID=A0A0G4MN02_VERLO|nr:hypothetical protein BN1723_014987 [Verticillium longisporum]
MVGVAAKLSGRVSSALGVSARKTNRGAFSGYNRETLATGNFNGLKPLNPGAELQGLAGVLAIVPIDNLRVFEVMHPNG